MLCYETMRGSVKWLLQGFIFTALMAVGVWVRCLRLNDPMPLAAEAPQVLAAAARAETLGTAGWPTETVARESPFHVAAALCARFIEEGQGRPSLRNYRALPLAMGVLLLPLVLGLGLRRRGGVFDTADGPLWTMALAALTPALVWNGWVFGPFTVLAALFLAMLTAARSYAQWPGYVPSATMGALWAVMVAVEPDALWLLLAVVPAVAVGVGWTRLCLYWQTLHMALAVAVGVGLWSLLGHFGLTGIPTLPVLPETATDWLRGPLWRLQWLCAWGLGAVACVGLAVWGLCRPDRRWARMLAALFLFAFAGSFFFREGGVFAVPLAVLTPLSAGVAISAVARPWVRWALGNGMLMVLCAALTAVALSDTRERTARVGQKTTFATLASAADAPRTHPHRIRVQGAATPGICAALLWPLRGETGRVVASDETAPADADILIVEESRLEALPPGVGQWVRPGRACVAPGQTFRVFAARPGEGIVK